MKRGHKRRERESNGKRWKKGANEAATEQGMYAGGSSRTDARERLEVTKRLTDED